MGVDWRAMSVGMELTASVAEVTRPQDRAAWLVEIVSLRPLNFANCGRSLIRNLLLEQHCRVGACL